MPLRKQWPWPGRAPRPECLAEQGYSRDIGAFCYARCYERIRTLDTMERDVPREWLCTRPVGHGGVHVGHFANGNVCARWTDEDARESPCP